MSGDDGFRIVISITTRQSRSQSIATKRFAVVEDDAVRFFLSQIQQLPQFCQRKTLNAATADVDFRVEVVLPHPRL